MRLWMDLYYFFGKQEDLNEESSRRKIAQFYNYVSYKYELITQYPVMSNYLPTRIYSIILSTRTFFTFTIYQLHLSMV